MGFANGIAYAVLSQRSHSFFSSVYLALQVISLIFVSYHDQDVDIVDEAMRGINRYPAQKSNYKLNNPPLLLK